MDLLAVQLKRISKDHGQQIVILALLWLIVCASIPLLSPLGSGHDMNFHLYRILGIAEGLKEGQFPVRMQYSQLNGMGYPVSIYYGDIFLYVPATLVLFGLSVSGAYKVYLVLLNVFVVLSTYVMAYRFSRSRFISFTISSVWTLGSYRLIDLYLRCAVGEYTALAFFPLIAYGLWCAFSDVGRETTKIHPFILLVVGMTGVALSHLISVLLAIMCLGGLLLGLMICSDRRGRGVVTLLAAIVTTTALCAYFAGPFIECYLLNDSMVKGGNGTPASAARSVSSFGQLLSIFPVMNGGDLTLEAGVAGEMPQSLGCGAIGLAMIYVISAIIRRPDSETQNQLEKVPSKSNSAIPANMIMTASVIIPLALLILQCCLPVMWNENLPWTSMLSIIQYPWRLLGPILLLVCLVGMIGLCKLSRCSYRELATLFGSIVILLTFVEGGYLVSSAMNNVHAQTQISAHDSVSEHVSGSVVTGEYLPPSADLGEILGIATGLLDDDYIGDGFTVTHEARQGREFIVEIDGGVTEASLPLLYYPYYKVVSSSSDVSLEQAANGLIKLVSDGSDAAKEVTIKFVQPAHWAVFDLVSLVSLIFVVGYVIVGNIVWRGRPVRHSRARTR